MTVELLSRGRLAPPPSGARGRSTTSSRASDETGQVELVIVFPVAMLLVLLVVQGALWFLGREVATDAAADGARAAAVVGGTDTSGNEAALTDLRQLGGPTLQGTSVSSTRSAGTVTVTIRGKTESILPGLSLPVSASASEPVERFIPTITTPERSTASAEGSDAP